MGTEAVIQSNIFCISQNLQNHLEINFYVNKPFKFNVVCK